MESLAEHGFLHCCAIRKGDVVSLVGAGGKTSLMFQLAREGRQRGWRVLVTTTTAIYTPAPDQYDEVDLSGRLFSGRMIDKPGIYVGGVADTDTGKMRGGRAELLVAFDEGRSFDLILIEADGAARKPLKAWRENEPVINGETTITIGVIDMQSLGKKVDETLVHRLELFTGLAGCKTGETLAISHLARVIRRDRGLFNRAAGKKVLYLNKVESERERELAFRLRQRLGGSRGNLKIVAGSLHEGIVYAVE